MQLIASHFSPIFHLAFISFSSRAINKVAATEVGKAICLINSGSVESRGMENYFIATSDFP